MLELGAKSETATQTPPRAGSRGQRVWAVLLVLDSFFVIIFGGALAAKLYQHWQAPQVVVLPPRPAARSQAKPAPAQAPAPKLAPAPATISLAKTAAPAKRRGGPTPNPSLLQDAPRHQDAQPQGTAAASRAAQAPAAAGAKVKAQPVEFHYKGKGHRVDLAGAFIVHGSGRKAMVQRDGAWTLTVYLTPNTYRYWFLVDGKKVLDPENATQSRGASVVSVAPPAR